jgi:hypothetical protein
VLPRAGNATVAPARKIGRNSSKNQRDIRGAPTMAPNDAVEGSKWRGGFPRGGGPLRWAAPDRGRAYGAAVGSHHQTAAHRCRSRCSGRLAMRIMTNFGLGHLWDALGRFPSKTQNLTKGPPAVASAFRTVRKAPKNDRPDRGYRMVPISKKFAKTFSRGYRRERILVLG